MDPFLTSPVSRRRSPDVEEDLRMRLMKTKGLLHILHRDVKLRRTDFMTFSTNIDLSPKPTLWGEAVPNA